jgi:exopolysaccharide biosynthesis polyprenyl glycosylphosphotransferase
LALIYWAGDFMAIVASYYAAVVLRFHSSSGSQLFDWMKVFFDASEIPVPPGVDYEGFYVISAPRIIFFLCATLSFLYAFLDLYAGRRFLRPRDVSWNIVKANLIALLLFYGYFYLNRNQFHPRSMFVTILFLNVVFGSVVRGMVDAFLRFVRLRLSLDDCAAVLVGDGRAADFIAQLVELRRPNGIRVAERMAVTPGNDHPRFLEELGERVQRSGAHMIICAENSLGVGEIMQVLELSENLGVMVKILSDKLEVLVTRGRVVVDTVFDAPLVHFNRAPIHRLCLAFKRAYSLVTAVLVLLLCSPLLTLIALLILATSGRPVFFVQERIGINRRPFRIFKFRTMHNRAEELQASVEEFNESGEALFKIRRDPRVTPIGRLLRRFSLDELPQLVNVIKGDMAIVGPRPLPRRDFNNYYEKWHYTRHGGLPGLTCLWQISGRSDIDFHSMCLMDVYYLRNQSPMMDLKIILRTLRVVLFARGAY